MEPAGDGREPSLDPIVERHNRCFWKGGYGFGEGWLLWGKRRLTLGVDERRVSAAHSIGRHKMNSYRDWLCIR
jgi:hypothetical protein